MTISKFQKKKKNPAKTMKSFTLNQRVALVRHFHSLHKVQKQYFLTSDRSNGNNIQAVCIFGDGRNQIMDNLKTLKRSASPDEKNGIDSQKKNLDEILIPSSSIENNSDIIIMQYNKSKNHLSNLHLSARYEHFKELEDPSVQDYITGEQINTAPVAKTFGYEKRLKSLIDKFEIKDLLAKNLIELSNGQFRRVEYVKQLMRSPKVLMINDPFIGIDPFNFNIISNNLRWEVQNGSMCLVFGLRNLNDSIPDWCDSQKGNDENSKSLKFQTELENGKLFMKSIKEKISNNFNEHESTEVLVVKKQEEELKNIVDEKGERIADTIWKLKHRHISSRNETIDRSHIRFNKFNLEYNIYQKAGHSNDVRNLPVFKDLLFDIKFGEKCQIKGFNGTGKSTILSLITLEHPKSYSSKIIYKGIPNNKNNYFELNSTISLNSPELHLVFPKQFSVFQCLSLGFNSTNNDFKIPKFIKHEAYFKANRQKNNIVILGNKQRDDEKSEKIITNLEILKFLINEFQNYFKFKKINIFEKKFIDLSLNDQKLVLFIKSLMKVPDLLILDESFSSMMNSEVESEQIAAADLRVLDIVKLISNHYKGTILYVTHDEANEMIKCDKFVNLMGSDKFSVGRYEYISNNVQKRHEVDVMTFEHGELVPTS